MSKKNKSLQKRPVRNTQPETAESHDKSISESRRRLLKFGLGAAGTVITGVIAERAGLFDALKDKESPVSGYKALNLPEYENWQSVSLPKVTVLDKPFDLSKKLDKEVSREALDQIRENFLSNKKQLDVDISNNSDSEKRYKIISDFFTDLFVICGSATDYPHEGRISLVKKDFFDFIEKTNRVLMQIGYFVKASFHPQTSNLILSILEIERTESVNVKWLDADNDFPVLLIKNKEDYYSHHEDGSQTVINFQYDKNNSMILADEKGAIRDFGDAMAEFNRTLYKNDGQTRQFTESASDDYVKSLMVHEGIHQTLDLAGITQNPEIRANVKQGVGVDMRRYTLPKEAFRGINNTQLSEIITHGVQMANSGQAAHVLAFGVFTTYFATKQESYRLVSNVILLEIFNSRSLPDGLRVKMSEGLRAGKIEAGVIASAINKFSYSEICAIGERMAKLGIYMTQK